STHDPLRARGSAGRGDRCDRRAGRRARAVIAWIPDGTGTCKVPAWLNEGNPEGNREPGSGAGHAPAVSNRNGGAGDGHRSATPALHRRGLRRGAWAPPQTWAWNVPPDAATGPPAGRGYRVRSGDASPATTGSGDPRRSCPCSCLRGAKNPCGKDGHDSSWMNEAVMDFI